LTHFFFVFVPGSAQALLICIKVKRPSDKCKRFFAEKQIDNILKFKGLNLFRKGYKSFKNTAWLLKNPEIAHSFRLTLTGISCNFNYDQTCFAEINRFFLKFPVWIGNFRFVLI